MARIYESHNYDDLEDFFISVSEKILSRNCSLFVGAGSSAQYNIPDWTTLISKFQKDSEHFHNVSQRAEYAMIKNPRFKTDIAKSLGEIHIDSKRVDTFLYHLLDFEFNSIWTTNYDSIIEEVMYQKSHPFTSIYDYRRFDQISNPGTNYLYKINGSVELSDSIIITKEDFIDYRRTHSAFLILMKRELICNSFLFIGCSFDDDILRSCLRDILICFRESGAEPNMMPNHYAVIVDKDSKLDFITKDMSLNYHINCIRVESYKYAYLIAEGICSYARFCTIFVSGAYIFSRKSKSENDAKRVCRELTTQFQNDSRRPYKFITGMGISIGHFISGSIKEMCKERLRGDVGRYLQMEPFPFTGENDSKIHRRNMIGKAGIVIFIYGHLQSGQDITCSGMYKEYLIAKENSDTIIIPIPCGTDTVSNYLFEKEKKVEGSFTSKNYDFLMQFDPAVSNETFFEKLYLLVNDATNRILKNKTSKIIDLLL
ncbi:MAG: SIR2 family protein [Lachnospiraceae bacterium]|nr:SIR2 family protein [Lachnospiraceae bacterium]